MEYRIVVCDDKEAAYAYEDDLKDYAKRKNKDIAVKRTSIGKVKSVSFEFAKLENDMLEIEQKFPNSFKPNGDEVLLQVTIKDKK